MSTRAVSWKTTLDSFCYFLIFRNKMMERGLPQGALQGGRTHPLTLLETVWGLLQSIQWCFHRKLSFFSEFVQKLVRLTWPSCVPCRGCWSLYTSSAEPASPPWFWSSTSAFWSSTSACQCVHPQHRLYKCVHPHHCLYQCVHPHSPHFWTFEKLSDHFFLI